jgi:predicted NBD/HSP70 family sugar kinase
LYCDIGYFIGGGFVLNDRLFVGTDGNTVLRAGC